MHAVHARVRRALAGARARRGHVSVARERHRDGAQGLFEREKVRVVAERAGVRSAERVRQQARLPSLAARAVEVLPRDIELDASSKFVARGSRAASSRAARAERQTPEPAAERGGSAAPEKRATRLARFVVPDVFARREDRLRLGGSARRKRRMPRLVHARLAPIGRELAQERSQLRAARGRARREAARDEPRDPDPADVLSAPFVFGSRVSRVRVFVRERCGRDRAQQVEVVVRVSREMRQRRGERRAFQSRLRRCHARVVFGGV